MARKFTHVPRLVGVSASTVLARKFSTHALAVSCFIYERTREALSELVLYQSDSTVKKKRYWRMNFYNSVILPIKLLGSLTFLLLGYIGVERVVPIPCPNILAMVWVFWVLIGI